MDQLQSKDTPKRELLFWVANHHAPSAGQPPKVDGAVPGKYYGYFQNEHGEQSIFIYDYNSRTGMLWVGDYSWGKPVGVVDGEAIEIIMSAEEKAWLQACWSVATTFQKT